MEMNAKTAILSLALFLVGAGLGEATLLNRGYYAVATTVCERPVKMLIAYQAPWDHSKLPQYSDPGINVTDCLDGTTPDEVRAEIDQANAEADDANAEADDANVMQ
jgi:GH24 family phage-related lysozyme (muramidase)